MPAATLDLHHPDLPRDLHAAVGALREATPLHRLDEDTWLLTRYDDVAALLKDRTRCGTDIHRRRGYDDTRPFGAASALETFQEGLLVNVDGEDHRRIRGASAPRYTRPAVERDVAGIVARHADDLFAALPDDGEADWVRQLAGPLPARVFADLFDLPRVDLDQIVEWLHHDTVAFDVLLSPGLLSPGDLERGQAAMLALREYLDALAQERLADRGPDLLSWLLTGYDAGTLTWDDVLTQAMESLAAGTATTMTLVAGMVEAFAAHPDEWVRLAADPSLARSAIEEALRWVSPALAMGRIANVDLELHGECIRAGDLLQCAVLSANRDPRAFADPERLDITRTPNRHVAFGGGVHTCLGAHIARLEAREVLLRAVARWRAIEVDADAVRLHPPLMIRTYAALPVRLVGR